MMALGDVRKKIKTNRQMHASLVANGKFMPEFETQIATTAFLREIYQNECYVPMLADCTFLPCAYRPSNEVLRREICGMIRDPNQVYEPQSRRPLFYQLAMHVEKANANQEWLLGLLSTMNRDHPVFAKDYRPPPRSNGDQQMTVSDPMVSMNSAFIQGLPDLTEKEMKGRGNAGLFLTKEQRAEQKCVVLQSKERQARERREKAEQELAFIMQQQ